MESKRKDLGCLPGEHHQCYLLTTYQEDLIHILGLTLSTPSPVLTFDLHQTCFLILRRNNALDQNFNTLETERLNPQTLLWYSTSKFNFLLRISSENLALGNFNNYKLQHRSLLRCGRHHSWAPGQVELVKLLKMSKTRNFPCCGGISFTSSNQYQSTL